MGNKIEKVEFFEDFYKTLPWEETPKPKWWRTALSKIGGIGVFLLICVLTPVIIVTPISLVMTNTAMDTFNSAYESIPYDIPAIPKLPLYSKVYDNEGNEYAQFYSEDRILISYDDIPEHTINALLATEDRKFWDHEGVDGMGVMRALITNYQAGSTVEGASTITQQLVQNLKMLDASNEEELFEAKGTTMRTKAIEAKTAMALEEEMTKEEILETYFNTVYFGAGAHGLGAAAKKYFNKPVSELTIPESAVIVGMVKSPSTLDPISNPEAALDRRNTVLTRMYTADYITEEELNEYKNQSIELNISQTPNGCTVSDYPFYCQLVKEEILSNPLYGETPAERAQLLAEGGLVIDTAMDADIMDITNEEVIRALGTDNPVAATVAIVEPGTGNLVAIGQNHQWGNDDSEQETQIIYAQSTGQPGSTFKPIIIASGLDNNINVDRNFTSNSPYTSSIFDNPPGGYDNNAGVDYGSIGVDAAVRQSVNVWFIKLEEQVGVTKAVETAKRIGVFDSLNNRDISPRSGSFALGAFDVSPIEMASVYSTFAGAGTTCKPNIITKVTDTRTGEIYENEPGSNCYVGLEEDDADFMTEVLQNPFKTGGTASKFPLDGGREAIGKTGTTNNHGAAWFVGATPQYSTAVWLGNPLGAAKHPLYNVQAYGRNYDRVFGADISGPIWNSIMERILDGEKNIKFSTIEPTSRNQAPEDEQLPTPPNVIGLKVTEAVNALINQGWKVVISSDTYGQDNANMVTDVTTVEKDTIQITLSNGSSQELLGRSVTIYTNEEKEQYLVDVEQAEELEGEN